MTVTTTTTTATETHRASQTERDVSSGLSVTSAGLYHAQWARYVNQHAESTCFHLPLWTETICDTFGHTSRSLIAWRSGEVAGVLPLIQMDSPLAGRMLLSTPYAPYGGVLAEDQTVSAALLDSAQHIRDEFGARVLTIRGRTPSVAQALVDDRYVTFRKSLPVDLKGLDTFLPRKARAAARQARRREGLSVRHDDRLLPIVYQLYTRSMRRLASLNYPLSFFERLRDRLGTGFWVTLVESPEQPIAGVISFVHGQTVSPYVLGVDERVRCTGATNLLYYAVMERAVKAQLAMFDFGRTRRDNTGPFAFKQNQGFTPQPLAYQHLTAKGASPPDLSPSNPRFTLARRIWAQLPLVMTRPLGVWLSRAVPG
jgi:FemAB-related protein (PEP-CTERM system-associated)